jgi:hypothetical protein
MGKNTQHPSPQNNKKQIIKKPITNQHYFDLLIREGGGASEVGTS